MAMYAKIPHPIYVDVEKTFLLIVLEKKAGKVKFLNRMDNKEYKMDENDFHEQHVVCSLPDMIALSKKIPPLPSEYEGSVC